MPEIRKFSGKLSIFNSGSYKTNPTKILDFLKTNLPSEDFELDAKDLEQLTSWLMVDISPSAKECAAASKRLLALVKKNEDEFVELSKSGVTNKDAVADFLTEALRIYNFAEHDPSKILEFRIIMRKCGITVVGEPEQCTTLATFEELGYNKQSHQVTMNATKTMKATNRAPSPTRP